jgi:hypothetical protein
MRHDVDSPQALEATLARFAMKQRAKRWVPAVPLLGLVIAFSCLQLHQQTQPKPKHQVVIGPWMLRVDGS